MNAPLRIPTAASIASRRVLAVSFRRSPEPFLRLSSPVRTEFAGRLVGFLLPLVLLSGCGFSDRGSPPGEVKLAVEVVGEVRLEDSDSALIGEIFREQYFDISSEGVIAVADDMTSRVLLFDSDGAYLRSVGREGDGPGEFPGIWALAWVGPDRLWVADKKQRIHVFDRHLALDTVLRVVDAEGAWGIQPAGDRVVIAVGRHPLYIYNALATYTRSGERVASFMPSDERAARVPYLGGEYLPIFRVVGDTVIGASNLTYPLYIYRTDGSGGTPFGSPPPSFRMPREPARGEFMGLQARRAFEIWRRTFGAISSIWVVEDSLLIVEHQYLDSAVLNRREARHLIDVYDRRSLRKIAEEIPIPGFIADVHEGRLWALTATPPDPWTFSLLELTTTTGQLAAEEP